MCRALHSICFNWCALSIPPQVGFILLQKSHQIEFDFSCEMTFGCTNMLDCIEGHSQEHQQLGDIIPAPDEKHQKLSNSLRFSLSKFKRSNSFPLRSCPFPDLSWERRRQEFILNYVWLFKTLCFSSENEQKRSVVI